MAKYTAYESALQVNTVSTTYVEIAQVRDISGPSMSADAVEVTARDTSKWRTFTPGLRDGGEVTFDIIYDPDLTSHSASNTTTGLVYFLLNGTTKTYRLVMSQAGGTYFQFSAIVTAFSPETPLEDAMTASVTLKITGAVTVGL
jgi:predicted secreted protein